METLTLTQPQTETLIIPQTTTDTATTYHSSYCNPVKYGVTKTRDLDTIAGYNDIVIDADNVIYLVAKYFNTNRKEVYSKKRNLNIVLARQISQYIVHNYLGYNKVETGRIFNKDHSSVINSINRFNNIIFTKDPIAYKKILDIFDKLDLKLK